MYFSSTSEALESSEIYLLQKLPLIMEFVGELDPIEPDFWAYEYDSCKWVPS